METQGMRIKKIRQSLGLSQDKFGEIFEISKQFVSLLEKDKTFLNNDKLVKLLLDYNVNINYLLDGIGEMFNNECENTHVLIDNSECRNRFKFWGDRLCKILSENMITPKEFAKRIGINLGRIEDFILNSAEPTMYEINAIKSHVDISIDELFYGEKVSSATAQPQFTAEEILKLKKLLNS